MQMFTGGPGTMIRVPNPMMHPTGPQLAILKQTSTATETIHRNGTQKKVHIVVKNAPFTIVMGLYGDTLHNQAINLHHLTFDAKLIYDTEGPEKEVDYVKIKPIVCKTKVNEAGDQVTADCRIKVLTSQHEDMLFFIKFITLDPHMGREFHPGMTILSEPIRVISKTDQVKPAKGDAKSRNTINDVLTRAAEVHQLQQRNDETLQKVLRDLEQRQQPARLDGWDLISGMPQDSNPSLVSPMGNLGGNMNLPSTPSMVAPAISSTSQINQVMNPPEPPQNSAVANFESSMKRFLICYNTLAAEDKATRIRKLMRNRSGRETERLSTFLAVISQESIYSRSLCACKRCHYQYQLETVHKNYEDDFLQF